MLLLVNSVAKSPSYSPAALKMLAQKFSSTSATYLKLPESSAARRNDLRYQLAEFWQKRKIQESKN
jgi:hypothetical protein